MIRRARVDDLNSLMKHGRDFIAYHPAKLKWNPKHVRGVVTDMILNHVVIVAADGGNIMGGIGGQVHDNLFDPDEKQLVELFWWVGEEWRNSRLGLMLFDAFEDAASILNCDSVVMTTTSLTPTLDKLYERRGYECYERTYMRRV